MIRKTIGTGVTALLVAASVAVPVSVHAQAVTIEQMQQALRERDATIAALEKRIAALEATSAAPASPASSAVAPSPAAYAQASGLQGRAGDEEELQALTRGLVQQGLLLLPSGALELVPSLGYSHSQVQGLVLVDTPEGISIVSDQRRREDSLEAALSVRYGLPWRSQIQVRVPYSWKRDEAAIGDGTRVVNDDTHIGDIEVELAHQLITESHGLPGMIAAVSWRIPTGRDAFAAPAAGVATGSGSHQLSGRLTALKSLDPIVAFGTLSYGHNFSRREEFGRVKPGDVIDLSLGALLAVSPETSVNMSFDQQFRRRTEVDGMPIAGSDGVAAVAQFGLDQLLSPRALLTASLGIGLTNDAPDYQFVVSTPIHF